MKKPDVESLKAMTAIFDHLEEKGWVREPGVEVWREDIIGEFDFSSEGKYKLANAPVFLDEEGRANRVQAHMVPISSPYPVEAEWREGLIAEVKKVIAKTYPTLRYLYSVEVVRDNLWGWVGPTCHVVMRGTFRRRTEGEKRGGE